MAHHFEIYVHDFIIQWATRAHALQLVRISEGYGVTSVAKTYKTSFFKVRII